MSKTKWYTKAVYIAVALAFVFGMTPLVAAQPGEAGAGVVEPVNTLRVYGEGSLDAAFPYTTLEGPFDLTSAEAPPKDFIQWNPAYMYHLDSESNGIYGNFFRGIVVNAGDANEKVHLRQWYVPEYEEPKGTVFTTTPEQETVLSPDIVKEYTYILLDTDNNPIAGEEGRTSFVFPIADNSIQIGIDDYDANRDGTADRVWLNRADLPNKVIDISTMGLTVSEGDVLQFLDHKAIITGISVAGVTADIYYQGNRGSGGYDDDELLGSSGLLVPGGADTATAGRHLVNDVGITAIEEPWYITAISSGATTASVQVGRLIQEGETFFVDGAEYDIAALHMPEDKFLKYITVRNPLPKEAVTLERLTIQKLPLEEGVSFPMLPPFNMVHDMIDDINIPELINELSPDEQSIDNPATDIVAAYDTIAERRVEDVDPIDGVLIEKWVSETKEPRFDQNLLEEKFTETGSAGNWTEVWQWINIETKPWNYTEFVLPELPDKPTGTGYTTGDYILVSSWMTEDSTGVWPDCGAVRVKFCYDAAYGPADITGLYVNMSGEPAQPTICKSETSLSFSAVVGEGNPASQTFDIWNCGDTGTTLDWSVSDGAAWLSESPPSGSSTGEHDTVTVSVDITGLTQNVYPAIITIADPDATNTPQTVAVTLTVAESTPCDYDTDTSGFIEIGELLDAIDDYIGGTINITQLLDVIGYYIGHTPC